MATLYVKDIPDELYKALRSRAREHHRSIAAEVLTLLQANIPTAKELKARQQLLRRIEKMHSKPSAARHRFATTEEMQREDRQPVETEEMR